MASRMLRQSFAIQPGQFFKQPCTQIQSRFPGPRVSFENRHAARFKSSLFQGSCCILVELYYLRDTGIERCQFLVKKLVAFFKFLLYLVKHI